MMTARRIATLLVFFLIFNQLIACSKPEKDKEALYQSALGYIENDEKDAAILELRSAIQLDAKFSDARYQLGLLYLDKGEPRKAFDEFVRAADLDPGNLDANLKTAQFFLLARKKEECRKRIEHILQKEPNHSDALALLSNLELIEGNFDAATEALDRIGEKVTTSDQLQNIKGRIHAAQEQWDLAEIAFKKAISVNKKNIANYQILLRLYEQKQENTNAKSLLDEMVATFPNDPQPHLLLAGYYKNMGEKEKVESELRKVVELTPDLPTPRIQLANYLRENGEISKAEEVLSKAAQELVDNTDIKSALATLYFDTGKFEQATTLLDEITSKEKDHSGAKLLQARFLLREGKVRDGIVMLQALNNDYPNWAEPYFYLGLAHYSLREVDLAEQAALKAIQKNSNQSKYHAFMAQIYQGKGSFSEARNEAAIALKLNPKNLRSAIILSRSLIGEKEFEKAVAILKNMHEQLPTNIEVLESLALAALGSKDNTLGETTLTKLLELEPGHNRGIALFLGLKYQNDLPGAQVFIEEQLKKAPKDFRLHLVLGGLLENQGFTDEALSSFTVAQELAPNNPRPYLAAAKLLTKSGRQKEAIAKYQSMLDKYPKSIPAHMGIAAIYEAKGEIAKAMAHYEETLHAREDFAPAANNLAWLTASQPNADLGKALQLAMVAKQAHPEDPHIADTLGWVHYKRNSFMLAITQFQEALAQAPGNPIIAYHLALAQAGKGDQEDAVQTLQKLLSSDIDFKERPEAEKLLAELKKKS